MMLVSCSLKCDREYREQDLEFRKYSFFFNQRMIYKNHIYVCLLVGTVLTTSSKQNEMLITNQKVNALYYHDYVRKSSDMKKIIVESWKNR
jgi:hypothetical protein